MTLKNGFAILTSLLSIIVPAVVIPEMSANGRVITAVVLAGIANLASTLLPMVAPSISLNKVSP